MNSLSFCQARLYISDGYTLNDVQTHLDQKLRFYSLISILRINLAGLPAHISFAGIFLVTIEPAPMTAFSPIETPLQIMHDVPINTLSDMVIGDVLAFNESVIGLERNIGLSECASVSVIILNAPIFTLLPIVNFICTPNCNRCNTYIICNF